jgi:uncharacterized repeat protein (TIGR01451 family)
MKHDARRAEVCPDRPSRRTVKLAWAMVLAFVLALVAAPTSALVLGSYPSTPKSWKVYGKAVQIGAGLMTNTVDYRFNDALKPSSFDVIPLAQKLPQDAVIVGAFLFWGGSAIDGAADSSAQFTLPDGFSSNVSADKCDLLTDPSVASNGTHFYCRKEVTSLIASHPGTDSYNGTYSVGDVQALVASIHKNGTPGQNTCPPKPGFDPNSNPPPDDVCCDKEDPNCQARHASWSLILVYDTKFSESTLRDVFLYDGFLMLDEKGTTLNGSLGQKQFTISNFLVGDPPEAFLSYHAMEGDKHLGNPEQDPDPNDPQQSKNPDSPPCATCWDFVAFNGTELTNGAANSEPHNIMNSSPPGGNNPGVDLDVFDVSPMLKTGDTSATFLVSSGNGSLADNTVNVANAGAGELFFLGASLLQINRKAPNFKSSVNKLFANASEASPGDVITYTVDLLNTGPVDAENTIFKLDQFAPQGTDYVAGSTTLDGKPVPDVGSNSAIGSGLQLGNLTNPAGGNQNRTITFKVKIKAVPGVSELASFGLVSYQYIGGKYSDSINTKTSVVKIVAPVLATPLLTVSPAKVAPGGTVTWTVTLQNATGVDQVVTSVVLDMPAEVKFFSATGPGQNKSSPTGGANGTGQARFDAVPVPANQQLTLTIVGTLKDVAGLQALGITPVNGHIVPLQGTVTVGTKTLKTDDPNQAGTDNPTPFLVQVLSDFSSSTKTMADLSPGTPLLPGDQVQFTLTLKNTGPGDGVLSVTDPLPSGIAFVSAQSPELTLNGTTVQAAGVTVPAGGTKVLIFTAQVKPDTPPGTSFANVATVSPTDGNPPTVIQTPQFVVQGGPDLQTASIKTAVDVNGGALEPGDTIQYTLTLSNSGKVATGALQVSDPVDKNLESVGNIDNGGAFDASTGAVLWSLPAIPAGGATKVSFSAKVKAGVINGTTIANTATISGSELAKPVQLTANVKVQAQPAITLFSDAVVSSGGATFKPGDSVTYTVSLQNTGNGVVNAAVLTSSYDAALTIVSASGGGVVQGQTVTWNLGTLQKGDAAKTLTIVAKLASIVAQDKPVTNQATLTGDGLGTPALSDDPGLPGTTDPTVFKVTSAPDLSTSVKAYLDVNGGIVQGGDKVQFTLSLKNTGNAPATQVVASDVLATALTDVQVQGGKFDAATRTVTWTAIPLLNPGDKAVDVTVTATVDKATTSGTSVANQGKIAFVEKPSGATTNTVAFLVQNLPDFGLSTKAASAAVVQSGDKVTYTLTIVNSGNAGGTNVTVTDKVPAELENVVVNGGTLDGTGSATWKVGTLAAGAQTVVSLTGTLKKPLDKGLQVCNQASIVATENTTPSLTNPPGIAPKPGGTPTCIAVDSAAKLTLTKDVFDATTGAQINQATVKPKTLLRYVIKAKDIGNAVAKGVAVSDVVPQELESVTPLDGGTFDSTTRTITWPVLATLGVAATDELVLRFEAKVAPALDNGQAVSNQAQLTYQGLPSPQKSDDPTTAAQGDPTVLSALSNVDFSKATLTVVDVNGGAVQPGDAVHYTLTLKNDGDGNGKNVTVTLPIDARLEGATPDGGGVLQGGVIVWNLGAMAPGQGAVLHIDAKVKKPQLDGAILLEQGLISAQGFAAPVLTDADLTTTVKEPAKLQVTAKADLSGSSWAFTDLNGGAVEPGDSVSFALTLRNSGDAMAQLVAVKALLQAQTLTAVQPFDTGNFLGDSIAWTVPLVSLTPTGDVTLHFQAKIAPGLTDGTKITVAAQLPGVAQPPQLTLTVEAKPRFETSLVTADDESGWIAKVGQVAPGHVVRVEVQVKNSGKAAGDNVSVTVPLPAKLANVQLITPGGTIGPAGVTFTLAQLAAGGQATLVFKATVAQGAIDGDTLPVGANIAATSVPVPVAIKGPLLLVVLKPILKLTKTFEDLSGKHLFPGDTLRFAITALNVGNAPAQGMDITDIVPASVIGLVPESGGTATGNTLTWKIATLAPGQTVTVTLSGKVASAVPNGAVLVNQAKAKPVNGAEVLSNLLQVPVKFPTLQVQTSLTPEAPATAPVKPGETVQLQVVVSSANAESASHVTVIVPVDPTIFDVTSLGGATYDPTAKVLRWTEKDNAALASIPGGGAVALTAALKVKATAKNGVIAQAKALAREGETNLTYESNLAQIQVLSIPVLAIKKTVTDLNGGKVAPLDVLRWRIEVGVTGGTAAQDVAVTDVLDGALDLVALGNGGVATGATLTWTSANTADLKTILPGTTAVLTFDARVKATVADAALIANQAQGLATGVDKPVLSDDPAKPGTSDPTVVQVRTASTLEASYKTGKDDNGGALLPGDTITWKIAVVATAIDPVAGVILVDTVPAGTEYVLGTTRLNGQAVADAGGQFPLTQGLPVASPGQPAGTVAPGYAQAAVVTFQTRVRADVADGSVVRNTATVVAGTAPPTPIGPVELTVGSGPSLRQTRKTVEVLDTNGNGQADVGEELRYTITVDNVGHAPADKVAVDDAVPEHARYVGGSLLLDGKTLTDGADTDAGTFDAKTKAVHVELGTVPAGGQKVVTLRMQITAGPVVANQAIVHGKGLTDEPSDADGDDGNGNQATIVQVGPPAPLLAVQKTVQDENGGDVRPGDALRYTITVQNPGGAVASGVTLTDVLPKGVHLPSALAGGNGNPSDLLAPAGTQVNVSGAGKDAAGTLTLSGLTLQPGEAATISLRVLLTTAVADGAVICNTAHAQLNDQTADSKAACLTVGAMVGEGAVGGTVFEDVGVQDGAFQPGQDLLFPHFQVQILPPEGADVPVLSTIVQDDGSWRVQHVPAGAHRVVVSSPSGVVFYRGNFTAQAQGGHLDIPLQPTGRVYDARTGQLAANVRVFLRFDDADPIAPGGLVPESMLPTGQQGQRTDATGAYAMQPPQGRAYRLDVAALSGGYAFPPVSRPPEPGLVVLDASGFVVADAIPKLAAELPRYLTRFSTQGAIAAPVPRHNHLPVDSLASAIRMTVRLSKSQAQIGDLVGITVAVQNGSTASLLADPVTGQGGIELRNAMPAGLGLVPGSARLVAQPKEGAAVQVALDDKQLPLTARRISATTGHAVGLDLPAGGALTLTMQAVVLAKAQPGQPQVLSAQAFEIGGAALSSRQDATLLVQSDPLFDRSLILGKVFCDGNGDGLQQDGEDGLPGARVFVDAGYYAVSDAYGRLHFVNLTPGNHLFKLDPDTLPPGSALTTEDKRVLYLTAGLGQSLTFGVKCALEAVGPTRVEPAAKEADKAVLPQGPGVVLIEADAGKLLLGVDGKPLQPRFVRAKLALAPEFKTLAGDATSVALAEGGELPLQIEASTGFARHAVEIRRVGEMGRLGSIVYEQPGAGEPPRTLTLTGLGKGPLGMLQPGRRFVVRVRAETSYGSMAWSAPLPFEVRVRVTDPRAKSWKLEPRPAQVQLNGHAIDLDAQGRAAVRILRPTDGRLLASVRAQDGSVREEFMTLGKTATGDAVAPPKVVPPAEVPKPVVVPPPAPVPLPTPPPTVAPAPKPAGVPVVVPVPVPVPAPVPAPVVPASGGFLTVPMATLPGGVLQLAGMTLTPLVKPLLLAAPPVPVPLASGQVLGRVLVQATGIPKDAQAAAIVLLDATGRPRGRMELGVPVPRTFYWEPGATTRLTPGQYGLALEVLVADPAVPGARIGWRSAPVQVELADRGIGLQPGGDPDKYVVATLFDAAGQPTESMTEWLDKTAVPFKADTGKIAVVSVYDRGPGDGQKRSESQADAVRKRLLGQGMRADRLLVLALGAAPSDFKPGLDKNGPHRVEVRLRGLELGSQSGTAPAFAVPEGVWIDGERVAEKLDLLPPTAKVHAGEASLVVQQRANGQAALWQRTFGTARVTPPGVSTGKAPQQRGPEVMDFGADLLDQVAAETRAAEGLQPIQLADAPTRERGFDSAAADLQVMLPRAGAELGSLQLPVRGHTRPGNKVTIQGQDVLVSSDGSFYALVPMPAGKSKLSVTSTDSAGNKAVLERPLAVRDKQFFLMAIADGSIGHVAAHLQETAQPGGWTPGDSNVQLWGRAAVYAKGRISGQYLGLKDLQFTAHLDTARTSGLQDFSTNLLDPTRFYPVYGDTGALVQDAQSLGKLYILVEADKTKAILGNYKAAVHGIELVRYDRALYGAQVDVRRTLGGDFDTRAQAFVGGQDATVRRHTDVLRGTGGSLYYLSTRDVVEGSERIELVVRDRLSGLEITRLPQTRNTDYTIDPREGRLLFKSPVSGAVDANFAVGQTGLPGQHLTWNGQPVFVEAVYEARGITSQDGTSFGVQVQEKVLGGKLALGGSYVQEGRGEEPTYRVVGADATVQLAKRSKVTAEYAYSQARDTLLSVSDDGGLSFGTPKQPTDKLSSGAPVSGQAVKIAVDVDLRDFLAGQDKPTDLPTPATTDKSALDKIAAPNASNGLSQTPLQPPKEIGRLHAHWQWVQAGFQSGGTIAQQGQQKLGLDTAIAAGRHNTLQIRYDGLLSDVKPDLFTGPGLGAQWGTGLTANSGSFSAWNRHTVTLQDVYRATGRWSVLGGNTYAYGTAQDGSAVHSDTLLGGALFRATDKLTVRADQQVTLLGDPQQYRSEADHFATTVGLEYKLAKALAVQVQERMGWGGQNSTLAGLRTQLDESSSVYLQQRLEDTYQTGHLASATVVGAESRYGADKSMRAYGEYQIDAVSAGAMNRAIMGVGKRFALAPGFNLDAGYERQQTFSGASGETARDALSIGGEWLRSDVLKVTSRQEVRLDQGDLHLGGVRKVQFLSLNNAVVGVTKELTLFGRANWTVTDNQTTDTTEAEALEATLGGAFRPIHANWLNFVGKYTHLIEMRPLTQDASGNSRATKDILSLEPMAELPWRLQLSGKLAWRRATESLGDGPAVTSDLVLIATRLGFHAWQQIDLAAEYRFLETVLTGDLQHGALLEAAYVLKRTLRLGAGYNFSHFVETAVGDIQQKSDQGGFFLRLTGMY